MTNFPTDLRYHSHHLWVRPGGEHLVRIGVSDFAQQELGDVVAVTLPAVGEKITVGNPWASNCRQRYHYEVSTERRRVCHNQKGLKSWSLAVERVASCWLGIWRDRGERRPSWSAVISAAPVPISIACGLQLTLTVGSMDCQDLRQEAMDAARRSASCAHTLSRGKTRPNLYRLGSGVRVRMRKLNSVKIAKRRETAAQLG